MKIDTAISYAIQYYYEKWRSRRKLRLCLNMLKEILNLKKKDVVAITGTGGKTTFMMDFGRKLKTDGKVLITVSTKIEKPTELFNDEIFYPDIKKYLKTENILTIISDHVDELKNKAIGLKADEFSKLISDFDYVLYEADGSRKKPLKAWREHEPVIFKETTHTVGVISIKIWNKRLSPENVFNFELFKQNFEFDLYFDFALLLNIVTSPVGLFKSSVGEKILFLNQCDDEKELKLAKHLKYALSGQTDIKIIYGSALKGEYYD